LINFLNAMINIPFALDYLVFKTGNLDNSVAPVIVNSSLTFFLLLTLHSTLTLMAEKLFILKYPICYHNTCTVKRARRVILCIWLSVSTTTLSLYSFRELRSSKNYNTLLEYMTAQHRGSGKYFVLTTTFCVFLLLVFLCYITCRELRNAFQKQNILVESNEECRTVREGNIFRRRVESQRSTYACRTILIIFLVYTVSFLPIMSNSFLRILDVTPLEYNRVQIFVPIFSPLFGALLHPIIFILRSNSYRKAAITLLRRPFSRCTKRNVVIGLAPSNIVHETSSAG
jgi:hypothetical protein